MELLMCGSFVQVCEYLLGPLLTHMDNVRQSTCSASCVSARVLLLSESQRHYCGSGQPCLHAQLCMLEQPCVQGLADSTRASVRVLLLVLHAQSLLLRCRLTVWRLVRVCCRVARVV
jgi:hypothetical protein